MNKTQLKQDMDLVLSLLPEASKIVLKYYYSQNLEVTYKKNDKNNPLTKADIEVDTFLKKQLTSARKSYGWLSEETEDNNERLNKNLVWIVDPIDGTKSFVEKSDEFAISIALCENKKIILGVVCNPVKGEIFSAIKGGGLHLNGKKIKQKPIPSFQNALALTSRSETKNGMWQKFESHIKTKMIGSIAYKMALIAAGKANMMATLKPKNEWDIAAGHLLCNEANVKVTDWEEKEIFYNSKRPLINKAFVAPQPLYSELVKFIKQHY